MPLLFVTIVPKYDNIKTLSKHTNLSFFFWSSPLFCFSLYTQCLRITYSLGNTSFLGTFTWNNPVTQSNAKINTLHTETWRMLTGSVRWTQNSKWNIWPGWMTGKGIRRAEATGSDIFWVSFYAWSKCPFRFIPTSSRGHLEPAGTDADTRTNRHSLIHACAHTHLN